MTLLVKNQEMIFSRHVKTARYTKVMSKNYKNILLIGPMKINLEFIKSKNFDFFLYIDGGIKHKTAINSSNIPYSSIGDQDSTTITPDILLNKDKDYNDLSAALEHLNQYKPVQIHLEGLCGGDMAHELANIGEILHFLNRNAHYKEITSDKWRFINKGLHSIELNREFSLFTLDEQLITLKGEIKYKAYKINLKPLSSHGLHNIGNGTFTVECEKSLLII